MCSSSELASIDIRSPEPLVDDWLRGGDLGFIFAQRGIGKTWIGLDLAHGIAEKRDVGPWKVHTQAKCLYLDGEMPPADIKRRDYALGKPSEASPTSITKFYSSGPGSDVLVLVNTFIFSLSVFFGLAFVTSRSAVDQTHNESTGHGISTVCRHSSVHVFPGVRARKTRHALLPQNRVTIVVETNWLASKRNREITKTITSGNRPEAHPRPKRPPGPILAPFAGRFALARAWDASKTTTARTRWRRMPCSARHNARFKAWPNPNHAGGRRAHRHHYSQAR